MNWISFLFGFKGRISRAMCWLALLAIFCWMIVLALLFVLAARLLGGPNALHFGVDNVFALVDPSSYRTLSRADLAPAAVHVIGMPVLLWIYLATSIKRLHDRDRSGWWIVPFLIVPGLYRQFEDRLPDSYVMLPVAIIVFILMVWGFLEIYCLKGSPWTNRFGTNPLPKVQTRPRMASR